MSETATEKKAQQPLPSVNRSIQDIVADLSKPVAARHLSKRKQGTATLDFITWHHAEAYLDYFAAGWSKEIVRIENVAGKIAMVVRISIPTLEGVITREACGYEEENTNSFGDPFSNAESMALRRAAANFGLGRYLYEK